MRLLPSRKCRKHIEGGRINVVNGAEHGGPIYGQVLTKILEGFRHYTPQGKYQ